MDRSAKMLGALSVIGAVVTVACSGDSGTGLQTDFNGVHYTAETDAITGTTSGSTALQFTVVATLRNTTSAALTRTYPLACPVRVRLYRQADDVLLYDETRIPCDQSATGTVNVAAQSTQTLQSGVRFPTTVLGDSLPVGTYTVRAVVMSEGSVGVLVDAGSVSLSK